jgi:hypothetical protein
MPASVSCEFQQGFPTVRGCPASYYLFHSTGRRMLVVPRGKQQRIRINEEIEVVVLDVKGDRVRLGIIGA